MFRLPPIPQPQTRRIQLDYVAEYFVGGLQDDDVASTSGQRPDGVQRLHLSLGIERLEPRSKTCVP